MGASNFLLLLEVLCLYTSSTVNLCITLACSGGSEGQEGASITNSAYIFVCASNYLINIVSVQ